jgi:5-methylcytosine-specific restriction protein A
MLATIPDADGRQLNAKIELAPGGVILHSRGGAFGKRNLRNPDYRRALSVILARLKAATPEIAGVWLDSSQVRPWPEDERLLVASEEFNHPVDQLVTMIGQRGAAKGRPEGASGHGNSTKRIRIGVPGATTEQLMRYLEAVPEKAHRRLSAATQRLVTSEMIDAAIAKFQAGTIHHFDHSREYDLLLPSGKRLPPKAIFGIALSEVIGRAAVPDDFSAGWSEPCFEIIEDAGYPIVPKSDVVSDTPVDADDERVWAEGSLKRVQHLERERKPGLARAKKRRFIEEHGTLHCERCGLVPSETLGPIGDACIEVHHRAVAVAKMDGTTPTRLADLQCLCANCHRIVHREQL